jgi:hypothetical protein
MDCHCCRRDVSLVHRVQILDIILDGGRTERKGYRTAFICTACYEQLDTVDGIGQVGGQVFKLDDASRFSRAPLYDRSKYEEYRQAEAVKLTADAS